MQSFKVASSPQFESSLLVSRYHTITLSCHFTDSHLLYISSDTWLLGIICARSILQVNIKSVHNVISIKYGVQGRIFSYFLAFSRTKQWSCRVSHLHSTFRATSEIMDSCSGFQRVNSSLSTFWNFCLEYIVWHWHMRTYWYLYHFPPPFETVGSGLSLDFGQVPLKICPRFNVFCVQYESDQET